MAAALTHAEAGARLCYGPAGVELHVKATAEKVEVPSDARLSFTSAGWAKVMASWPDGASEKWAVEVLKRQAFTANEKVYVHDAETKETFFVEKKQEEVVNKYPVFVVEGEAKKLSCKIRGQDLEGSKVIWDLRDVQEPRE